MLGINKEQLVLKEFAEFVLKESTQDLQEIRFRNYQKTRMRLLEIIEHTLFGKAALNPGKNGMQ